jgi:hypothetical protein
MFRLTGEALQQQGDHSWKTVFFREERQYPRFFLLHLPWLCPVPAFRMPALLYLLGCRRPRMSVFTSTLGHPHRQGLSSWEEITGEEEAIIGVITTGMDIGDITIGMDTGCILTTDLITNGTGMVIEQSGMLHRNSASNGPSVTVKEHAIITEYGILPDVPL